MFKATKRLVFYSGFAAISIALASFCDAAEELPTVPVYYDTQTGNVTLDATRIDKFGTYIWPLEFEWPLGFEGFNIERYTPFMNGTLSGGWTSSLLGETDLATVTPGVYSLGHVLPPGLTAQELDQYFVYFRVGGIGTRIDYEIVPIFAPSPFPALNADGHVVIPPPDKWATAATISYDARNGEVSLNTTGAEGGAIFSYSLQFTKPVINTAEFQAINQFSVVDPWRLTEITASPGGIPEGMYSLGPILAPGMSLEDLTGIMSGDGFKFISEPGHDVGSLDLAVSGKQFSLKYIVPEPNAGILGILGLCALTLLRPRLGKPKEN